MDYLEIALFVAGAVLLLVGYRKSNRNLLVAAAILLLLTGTIRDITTGFTEGLDGTASAPQQPSSPSV